MPLIRSVDWFLKRGLPVICGILLAAMVGFTIYTVIMRTVFLDPPFWGDTLTLFANIWLVMLAFALSIRERQSIAMQVLYDRVPNRVMLALEFVWIVLFGLVGILVAIYGFQAANLIPGAFWELGNLPKFYPMLILPISGVLITIAAALVFAEDVRSARRPRLSQQENPPG